MSKGVRVNENIPAPRAPGPWVDEERCFGCREESKRFRPGVAFADGVELVRSRNGETGGFRSRGPVLYAMRVLKLSLWYERHSECDGYPWRANKRTFEFEMNNPGEVPF